jgi:cytochrome c553
MRPFAGLFLLPISAFVSMTVVSAAATQDPQESVLERGRAVYESKCVSCHGQNGSGSREVPAPIFGDRPTSDLADLISRTMPEGAPEDCVGDDARAVAEWMQVQFYSPEAQARLHPPAIEFSRLTVSQHRNAIADLAMSFRWYHSPGANRGLKAEYYADRKTRKEKRVIERTDPNVNFSFGAGSPDTEKIPPEEFSMEWQGSVIPRETGWYEFTVRTENAARLFVNDRETPLVDAWVRSGPGTEFRGSRLLLAGRLYPLRLEWFKFKEPTSSVALLWKPPNGVEEAIPAAHLTPEWAPEVLVIETPFPPDDRSSGYERGTSVSKEWFEASTNAAIEAADKLVRMRRELFEIKDGEDRTAKMQEFARLLVERAFRRPLTDETRQMYVDAQFAATPDPDEALRRVILLALKSPRFLYREAGDVGDQFDRASRLSFALLNSSPDKQLLEAAANGQLETNEQLREHAWRLMSDFRSRARLLEFLRQWMNLERLQDISKETASFPDFTPQIASDLRVSLEMLLEQSVDAENSDFRRLLLNDQIFFNGRLAAFYGADLEEGAEFQEVTFEPEQRTGIVTHPFLLSGFAYMHASSPIHRGVFLSRGVLWRGVKPPPIAVAPAAPDLAPELTTRERVTLQTSAESCVGCHGLINSLGFALENFDAVGRYRDNEKNKPIDATGHYLERNGQLTRFNGARELAEFLARSEETHRSFSRQLFHHMIQQPVLAYGPDTIAELADFFEQHEYNMKQLMVDIACRAATHDRRSTSTQPVVAAEAPTGQ